MPKSSDHVAAFTRPTVLVRITLAEARYFSSTATLKLIWASSGLDNVFFSNVPAMFIVEKKYDRSGSYFEMGHGAAPANITGAAQRPHFVPRKARSLRL